MYVQHQVRSSLLDISYYGTKTYGQRIVPG